MVGRCGLQTESLPDMGVGSSLDSDPGRNHERSMMTRYRTDHQFRRIGLVAFTIALLGWPSDTSAQRAFVLNAVPSVRDAFAAPAPPPILDRAYMRDQLRYPRVVEAWVSKRFNVIDMFEAQGVTYPAAEVFLRVFKKERAVELWARSPNQGEFTLIKSYEICALSDLGPKRRQGDGQTPEGFYWVDFLNPQSEYYLSMHVNYPNAADQLVGRGGRLGGDIFIHGDCVTNGCIAVTDESIKELYWIAVEARAVGQSRIPVHIFPTRLDEQNMARLARVYREQPGLVDFWRQLRGGYEHFERTRQLPDIRVSSRGRYLMPGEVDEHDGSVRVLGERVASTSTTLSVEAQRAHAAQAAAPRPSLRQDSRFVLGQPVSFAPGAEAGDSVFVGGSQR